MVAPGDQRFSAALWERLAQRPGNGAAPAAGQRLRLRRGEALQALDRPVRQFYILLEARARLYELILSKNALPCEHYGASCSATKLCSPAEYSITPNFDLAGR